MVSMAFFVGCDQPAKNNAEEVKLVLPYVRYNADSPKGVQALKSMALAMKEIKALPCENPVSWYYQGAIHWVPDTVLNNNPFCPAYLSVADTMRAWNNCTHIPDDSNSDYQFLIWHRLYIWHFEKIIRSFSKNKEFALPFWKYVDPNFRKMPPELRAKTSSLYTKDRLDSLNTGDPISASFARVSLDSATASANEAKTYSVFNNQIDAAPHGAMHDYIGGGWSYTPMFNSIYQAGPYTATDTLFGWMAHVPSAGFDPVFWLHHANIDFLWNEWENGPNGERPPLDSVMAHPWSFVFPEPDGTFVTYTMQQAYERAFNPNYVYQGAPPMIAMNTTEHEKLTEGAQLMIPKERLLSEATLNKAIGKKTTALPLEGELKEALSSTSGAMLTQESSEEKEFIIQVTVSFTEEPKGQYVVYLDDEEDQSDGPGHFLGIMSFFGAAHHATAHAGHSGSGLTKTFLFDASDELIAAGETPHLVFQRSGGGDVGIVVERISVFYY